MLKTILSISGKPGLFRLVSQGKNMLIVESLANKKRTPAYAHDKVVSLGDIAIYTSDEEVPLEKVFDTIFAKNEGKAIDAAKYKTVDQLREFFADILPTYDRDRVYDTDIKKIISWYNILVNAGFTKFESEKEVDNQAETAKESTENKE